MLEEIRAFFLHLNFNRFIMKNIVIVLGLLLFISCSDSKEKAVYDLISQNNKYYELTLAEYKTEEKVRESDAPSMYDKEYHDRIFKTMDAIANLKDIKTYDTIFEAVKKLGYEYKVKKIIGPIQSENKEVLKNNLYVNLMNTINAYRLYNPIGVSTHCRFGPYFRVRKVIEKDSVKLDIHAGNPYQLSIDSVKDGHRNTEDYKVNEEYKVWSIRYKPKSKTTGFYGKLFYKEGYYENLLFVQALNEVITK